MAYVPRGRPLVVGGDDGFLALFDPRSGRSSSGCPATSGLAAHPQLQRRRTAHGDRQHLAAATPVAVDAAVGAAAGLAAARRSARSSGPGTCRSAPTGGRWPSRRRDGRRDRRRRHAAAPRDAAGSRDGASLARFTPDGRSSSPAAQRLVRLWSTDDLAAGRPPARRPHRSVLWESISPDGRTLATGSMDGTIRLFDLRTQQPLGAPLPGLPNRPVAPLFTPDGAYLFAITDAGRAYRWDVRPSSWARHACAVAGRTLTRAEWRDALPGREYAPACAG